MSSQTPEVSERSTSPGQGGSTSPLALLARHPLSAYYLLMGSALLLLLLGLIMVMSASSIESKSSMPTRLAPRSIRACGKRP